VTRPQSVAPLDQPQGYRAIQNRVADEDKSTDRRHGFCSTGESLSALRDEMKPPVGDSIACTAGNSIDWTRSRRRISAMSHIGWAVSAVALRPRFCRPPPNRTGDFRTHPALQCPEIAKGFGHGHVAHLTLPGSGPPVPLGHVDGFPALGLLRGLCRHGADPNGISNPVGDLVFHIM
jgi:hypothetical protein